MIDGQDVSAIDEVDLAGSATVGSVSSFSSFTCLGRQSAARNVELPLIYAGVRSSAERRDPRRRRAGRGRDGGPDRAPAQPALRRPAATRRDRPRAGHRSRDHPRRRANRQPRLRPDRRGARDLRAAARPGPHRDPDHPRARRRPPRAAAGQRPRRPDRVRPAGSPDELVPDAAGGDREPRRPTRRARRSPCSAS